MLHLITGGSASGKSAYGEQAVLKEGKPFCYYLATMHPWGEEGRGQGGQAPEAAGRKGVYHGGSLPLPGQGGTAAGAGAAGGQGGAGGMHVQSDGK